MHRMQLTLLLEDGNLDGAALLRILEPTIANYQPSRLRLSLVVGLPHWEIWYDFWPRPAYRAMPERGSKPYFLPSTLAPQVLVLGPFTLGLAGKQSSPRHAMGKRGQPAHRPPLLLLMSPPWPTLSLAPDKQTLALVKRNTLRVPRNSKV